MCPGEYRQRVTDLFSGLFQVFTKRIRDICIGVSDTSAQSDQTGTAGSVERPESSPVWSEITQERLVREYRNATKCQTDLQNASVYDHQVSLNPIGGFTPLPGTMYSERPLQGIYDSKTQRAAFIKGGKLQTIDTIGSIVLAGRNPNQRVRSVLVNEGATWTRVPGKEGNAIENVVTEWVVCVPPL